MLMRTVIILALIFFSAKSFGQTELRKQLKEIIADTSNGFSKFKGKPKDIPGLDSVFYSTMVLPETFGNDISYTYPVALYSATIKDSASKKLAVEIVEDWKYRLSNSIGQGFKIAQSSSILRGEKENGYKFENGNFTIFINYNKFLQTKYYTVRLTFAYDSNHKGGKL